MAAYEGIYFGSGPTDPGFGQIQAARTAESQLATQREVESGRRRSESLRAAQEAALRYFALGQERDLNRERLALERERIKAQEIRDERLRTDRLAEINQQIAENDRDRASREKIAGIQAGRLQYDPRFGIAAMGETMAADEYNRAAEATAAQANLMLRSLEAQYDADIQAIDRSGGPWWPFGKSARERDEAKIKRRLEHKKAVADIPRQFGDNSALLDWNEPRQRFIPIFRPVPRFNVPGTAQPDLVSPIPPALPPASASPQTTPPTSYFFPDTDLWRQVPRGTIDLSPILPSAPAARRPATTATVPIWPPP